MSRIRTLSVAALVMALAVAASSARAADEKKVDEKKSDSGAVHGVVVAIVRDADKDKGTFTVKVHEGKKAKDAVDAKDAEPTTFKVNEKTTFAKVAPKKKDPTATAADEKAEPESTPATFADLKEGDVVAVVAKDGVAVSVKFHAGHKPKKPAA
jgi:hypothetical protein